MEPKPPGTQPAVSSPETSFSLEMRLPPRDTVALQLARQIVMLNHERARQWVDAVRRIIVSAPEYPKNIWRELGFWLALRTSLWMVCHPYSNTRLTVRTVKWKLLKSLEQMEDRRNLLKPTEDQSWDQSVLECCEHAFREMQRVLDSHGQMAYERVMRGIQPPALYPERPQQVARAEGTTLSELIDQVKEGL
jgi:hypothetical protein